MPPFRTISSRAISSKASCTLWFSLADVSRAASAPFFSARVQASSNNTCRWGCRSHLLPEERTTKWKLRCFTWTFGKVKIPWKQFYITWYIPYKRKQHYLKWENVLQIMSFYRKLSIYFRFNSTFSFVFNYRSNQVMDPIVYINLIYTLSKWNLSCVGHHDASTWPPCINEE